MGRRYSREVYERACEWFVEFRSAPADEQVRRAFHAWLQQAPAHMAAYLDVASSWNWTETLDVSARFTRDGLIAAARESDNLLLHPGAAASGRTRARGGSRSGWFSPARAAIAAGALALIAGALVSWMLARGGPVYSTGIGQKRLIRLADGSIVHLNAQSRIIVRYTRTRREIDLLRGQALFVDTYEPDRPFIVRSRGAVVRAVGTQFDVNQLEAETIVTVIQGKVAVAQQPRPFPASHPSRPPFDGIVPELRTVYLSAGEQLTVTRARHMLPVRANVRDAIAWTHHKLIFTATDLRDVVQEFNRYNTRPLLIASPSLADFKIDGVFSSTNPKSLIAFLQQVPGVKVTETGQDVVISRQ